MNSQVAFIEDADGNKIMAGYTGGLLTSLTAGSGVDSACLQHRRSHFERDEFNGSDDQMYLRFRNQCLLSVTDFDGYTTSYSYNTAANTANAALLTINNPDGTQQDFICSAQSHGSARLRSIMVPKQFNTRTALAAPYHFGPRQQFTSYFFDYRGQLAKLIDPLGNATYYSYDATGNLVQVTDPAGQVYSYAYDSKGNMIKSTDPLGDVTQFLLRIAGHTLPPRNRSGRQYDRIGTIRMAT